MTRRRRRKRPRRPLLRAGDIVRCPGGVEGVVQDDQEPGWTRTPHVRVAIGEKIETFDQGDVHVIMRIRSGGVAPTQLPR